MHRLLLGLATSFLIASATHAQPILTASSDAHPGDTVNWSVSGATANASVVILVSGRNQGMTFGPFDTHCGTVEVSLGIGPGFRPVGRGRVAPDGTFSSSLVLSSHLPARLDGVTVYSQAVTVQFSNTPHPQSCSIVTATSNVAPTALHVP